MSLRRCKIIATVGPASRREDVISALLDAGVDAFRLNFSYGSGSEHTEAVRLIRALAAEQGRPVAIIQDLPGAKIRLGKVPGGLVSLAADTLVTLAPRGASLDSGLIPVNYPNLATVVRPGDRVLLGDGEVALRVESVASGEIRARALTPGAVKDNQGVTLPDASLAEGAATAKDLAHLQLGLQLGSITWPSRSCEAGKRSAVSRTPSGGTEVGRGSSPSSRGGRRSIIWKRSWRPATA